jgi:hypothetical protein
MTYILEEMILPDFKHAGGMRGVAQPHPEVGNWLAACHRCLRRRNRRAAQNLGLAHGLADREGVFRPLQRSLQRELSRAQRESAGKDRINCVNAKLRNHAGQHRLFVDRSCKHLIKDFEQVCWKTDPHGNPLADLDKSNPMRDAVGYMVAREFPMRDMRGETSGPMIC